MYAYKLPDPASITAFYIGIDSHMIFAQIPPQNSMISPLYLWTFYEYFQYHDPSEFNSKFSFDILTIWYMRISIPAQPWYASICVYQMFGGVVVKTESCREETRRWNAVLGISGACVGVVLVGLATAAEKLSMYVASEI